MHVAPLFQTSVTGGFAVPSLVWAALLTLLVFFIIVFNLWLRKNVPPYNLIGVQGADSFVRDFAYIWAAQIATAVIPTLALIVIFFRSRQ